MLERTVQGGTTFYRCDWPDNVSSTIEVLSALIDAGMPGTLEPITIEIPYVRVSRQSGGVLEVAVPGNDGGDWRSTITETIEGMGS